MKILMWIAIIIVSVVVGAAVALYIIGGQDSQHYTSQTDRTRSHSNFNTTYTIPLNEAKCGELGYRFKMMHEKLGYSKTGAMSKSNCRINSDGHREGYIYSETNPALRVFWVEKEGAPVFQE